MTSFITPTLLSTIRTHPHLPTNTWYFITTTSLSILNRPDQIPIVYQYALTHGAGTTDSMPKEDEQLSITRRIREALIKSAPIGGLPKTINALGELKNVTPAVFLDEPNAFSPTSRRSEIYDGDSSTILDRGQKFFNKTYGKVSQRIIDNMDHSGTEDLGLTTRLFYGYIFSNVSVLTPVETSYALLASLIPQDVNPQLKGHLKGALNSGASVENVKAVREVIIKICEASGMRRLSDDSAGGWGWRREVANL